MATVHIREIARWLDSRGVPEGDDPARSFLEIRFDEPDGAEWTPDEEMRDRVITTETPFGSVTLTWDGKGLLRSLDIS